MRVLVEIHNESELERALEVSPEIVGVNARNLKTLEIDLEAFSRLIPQIPSNIYRVAESGISRVEDVKIACTAGADAILVGESLVKSGTPSKTIAEFLSVGKV
jgi:indole-3-glycerol phosphate synthase